MTGTTVPAVTGEFNAAAAMGLSARVGPWGNALIQAARERHDIVALSADLKKYTDLSGFAEAFPDRYIEIGMAEQSLVLTAAGLAYSGLTPIATSFAAFLARRTVDFVTMQIALSGANVILVGATPGISATFGPSHTSTDDLAIWRTVPNLTVIDPMDPLEAAEALSDLLARGGPAYLRQPFNRAGTERSATLPRFELGHAQTLRSGADITIIASGDRVTEALTAAEDLARERVSARVIRSSTIKPFDGDTVAEAAALCPRIVTAENHSVIGGLFSAVSAALTVRGVGARIVPIGVADIHPPFGSPPYTARILNMTADNIADAARGLLA
jgi:transketolase